MNYVDTGSGCGLQDYIRLAIVSSPDPTPSAREKGLVTIARFLVCADSAVLISRKPIRTQVSNMSCDKHACMRYIYRY